MFTLKTKNHGPFQQRGWKKGNLTEEGLNLEQFM